MSKAFRCDDLRPGCSFEARGNFDEEGLTQTAAHARTAHNLTEIPAEMIPQVRASIREDDQALSQAAGS